jgi:hypothetical protein
MVNEHVSIHELSITLEKIPALTNFEIWQNSVRLPGISTTHAKWDN